MRIKLVTPVVQNNYCFSFIFFFWHVGQCCMSLLSHESRITLKLLSVHAPLMCAGHLASADIMLKV